MPAVRSTRVWRCLEKPAGYYQGCCLPEDLRLGGMIQWAVVQGHFFPPPVDDAKRISPLQGGCMPTLPMWVPLQVGRAVTASTTVNRCSVVKRKRKETSKEQLFHSEKHQQISPLEC